MKSDSIKTVAKTFALTALCGTGLHASAAEKPNVILIMADDLGVGDVGCYGSVKIKTPNLDRLASEGLRALNANATASVCTPSRYAILTGTYYHQGWNGELLVKPGQPTIASVLHDNGYATGLFGKWHLGWGKNSPNRKFRADIDWNQELPAGVLECGFDTFFGTPFTFNEAPSVFVHDRQVVGLESEDPLVVPPDSKKGFGRSTGAKKAHAMRPESEIDLMVTKQAQQWLAEHHSKPFFLNLALAAPHVPINPSEEFRGKSGAGLYGDFVEQMDWCVGQILQTLKECGVESNTLIIFTSDNGAVISKDMIAQGHRSNLNWLGQKTDVWEGGHRQPLIVRWPGKVPAGTTTDAMISLADIVRTVWDAAGVKAPEGAAKDSISQLSVWAKPDSPPVRKEMIFSATGGLALRSGDWVYIPKQGSCGITTTPNGWGLHLKDMGQTNSDYDAQGNLKADAPKEQLYNLQKDPSQSQNVVRDYPEKAREMAAQLEQRKATLYSGD
jgi:arylsulfatase A-like enzyme